jgi:G3E family GTPase
MIPVSIVTGFLGSGKTTLLNRLVSHQGLDNTLVIINEFGEIGIDHLLVCVPSENLRLLRNGCLCCEVRGDLIDTLIDVSNKRMNNEISAFDRILIETTGLADPVPLIATIVTDAQLSPLYRLDCVAAVVDAVHALSQLASHREARKQVAVADVLLLSKTDLVDAEHRREVTAELAAINRGAALIPVLHGELDPARLFGRGARHERDLVRWLADDEAQESSAGGDHSLHRPDVTTFSLVYEGRVTLAGLGTWLSMLASLSGLRLLRVKGIVNVAGEPFVIHVVQSVIHPPAPLDWWPDGDRRTRMVFIVRGLERCDLQRTVATLAMTETAAAPGRFDPHAYAGFRDSAKRFIGREHLNWEQPL